MREELIDSGVTFLLQTHGQSAAILYHTGGMTDEEFGTALRRFREFIDQAEEAFNADLPMPPEPPTDPAAPTEPPEDPPQSPWRLFDE